MDNEMFATPTRNDFENWRNSYVTQWYFDKIREMITGNQQLLGEGGTLDRTDMVRTQTWTAEKVGHITACEECLAIEPEYEDERLAEGEVFEDGT